MKTILLAVSILILSIVTLVSCSSGMEILDGATHACGELHVEGYFTDSQGDVVVAKAPETWTPEQVKEFCSRGGN